MDFWKRRRGEKLYKQWVTYSGLPSETIPRTGVVNSESVMKGERNRLEPYKETFGNIGMAIKEVGDRYTCDVCGNEIVVTKVGSGTLGCCSREMERVE